MKETITECRFRPARKILRNCLKIEDICENALHDKAFIFCPQIACRVCTRKRSSILPFFHLAMKSCGACDGNWNSNDSTTIYKKSNNKVRFEGSKSSIEGSSNRNKKMYLNVAPVAQALGSGPPSTHRSGPIDILLSKALTII